MGPTIQQNYALVMILMQSVAGAAGWDCWPRLLAVRFTLGWCADQLSRGEDTTMTQTAKAIVAAAPGGPEVLQLQDVEVPSPGPGQLLVKVAAAGVNFIETYERSGTYKVSFPFTPGGEAAGTVAALGEGVDGVQVGDWVAFSEGSGTYAEFALVPAEAALPVPGGVGLDVAAALPLQ